MFGIEFHFTIRKEYHMFQEHSSDECFTFVEQFKTVEHVQTFSVGKESRAVTKCETFY